MTDLLCMYVWNKSNAFHWNDWTIIFQWLQSHGNAHRIPLFKLFPSVCLMSVDFPAGGNDHMASDISLMLSTGSRGQEVHKLLWKYWPIFPSTTCFLLRVQFMSSINFIEEEKDNLPLRNHFERNLRIRSAMRNGLLWSCDSPYANEQKMAER